MKIKSGFVIEEVGDGYLAVAVGDRADEFSGLVRMNATGAFLWKLIEERDMSKDELLSAVLREYDVDEAIAKADIDRFEAQLREGGIIE
ncbi:MAG: PqqD family protein [Clostridia bacterium]|nr:PqqD family protein [Clostridia bacterium]